jgi:uncharacterized tellurite resistance protein B-like protein
MISGSDLQALGETKLESLVELMFLAAAADGDFSDVEHEHFVRSVESLTDGRIPHTRLEALVTEAVIALDRDGREARLASLKTRLPDAGSRRVGLSLALQVTAADGIMRKSGRELILETAEALEIDRDDAANLLSKKPR